MSENITKESFDETITALVNASAKNSSKGNAMKDWFRSSFNIGARVARITEDKQLGNRITEQYSYRDPIVVFVIEPSVNRPLLVEKIKERQYPELLTVLVVVANDHNGDYAYGNLLVRGSTPFSEWATTRLLLEAETLGPAVQNTTAVPEEQNGDILAAIRAKPFILLAGMSGTGKTRIVRQLARGFCPSDGVLDANPAKPGNYECIPVRPNWHDSTGLLGYVTRITDDGKPKYVATEFVHFLARAWRYEDKNVPFFLCLDEMNLAPVEQYFAEYLSVIESRQIVDDKIVTDPIVRIPDKKLLQGLLNEVYPDQAGEVAALVNKFEALQGIPIPSNLVVMGTVNMDETTCSFPRKVLDRAMTFELNEFNIDSGLDANPDVPLGSIPIDSAKCSFTHGWQVYKADKDSCDKIKPYLVAVDDVLKGTPFRFAYRTRDEFMAYCVERMRDGTSLANAADEATNMKILSRIEGDEQLVKKAKLETLKTVIIDGLKTIAECEFESQVAVPKLTDMINRLEYGSTSFWM